MLNLQIQCYSGVTAFRFPSSFPQSRWCLTKLCVQHPSHQQSHKQPKIHSSNLAMAWHDVASISSLYSLFAISRKKFTETTITIILTITVHHVKGAYGKHISIGQVSRRYIIAIIYVFFFLLTIRLSFVRTGELGVAGFSLYLTRLVRLMAGDEACLDMFYCLA